MSAIDQICNYIAASVSLDDCRKIEKAIRERKSSLITPVLDLNKVRKLIDADCYYSLFGEVAWKKEIILSLTGRIHNDFDNLFRELVPSSNGLTNRKAASQFHHAFDRHLQLAIQQKEAELEANKRQSSIITVYNPVTDRYETRYREETS